MDKLVSALEEKEAHFEREEAFLSKLEKKIERLVEQHRKLHIAVLNLIT